MPPPPMSMLDFTQILQRVFDEANGRLRTDAAATVVAGSLEVIISHVDDSIRIGDGTDLVTTTTVGPKVGLDVNVVNAGVEAETVPFIANVAMPTAGTEYSYNIPDNTKSLKIRAREASSLRIAYTAGGTSTTYFTLSRGATYEISNINSVGNTIYIQSDKDNQVLEIDGWHS